MPCLHFNQVRRIVNSNFASKFLWNLNRNITLFIQENEFDNVDCRQNCDRISYSMIATISREYSLQGGYYWLIYLYPHHAITKLSVRQHWGMRVKTHMILTESFFIIPTIQIVCTFLEYNTHCLYSTIGCWCDNILSNSRSAILDISDLTHWGRDKMDAISQTPFSIVFSWIKWYEFRLRFHCNLFLEGQLTIFQHWFRYWLSADQATSHYLNQWWLF